MACRIRLDTLLQQMSAQIYGARMGDKLLAADIHKRMSPERNIHAKEAHEATSNW